MIWVVALSVGAAVGWFARATVSSRMIRELEDAAAAWDADMSGYVHVLDVATEFLRATRGLRQAADQVDVSAMAGDPGWASVAGAIAAIEEVASRAREIPVLRMPER